MSNLRELRLHHYRQQRADRAKWAQIICSPLRARVPRRPREIMRVATILGTYTQKASFASAMTYLSRLPVEAGLMFLDVISYRYDSCVDKLIRDGAWHPINAPEMSEWLAKNVNQINEILKETARG